MYTLRDYQDFAVTTTIDHYANGGKGNGLVLMPTGCHAKDHPILMFDGSVKPVQNVRVGDELMGPDSQPRKVLALARGRQEMREIVPVKGEPFVVNLDHKLNVKHVAYRGKQSFNETITVAEYEKGSRWSQHLRKLRRVGVGFANKDLPLDPYFVGLMLGDGSLAHSTVTFSGSEQETLEAIRTEARLHGCNVREVSKQGTHCKTLTIADPNATRSKPNRIMGKFRTMGLAGTNSYIVFIPQLYKCSSRSQRLEVLAGLLDSDGYLDGSCFEHVTMSRQLADDLRFVCRSLGFAAYTKEKTARYRGEVTGVAYKTMISGHTDEIPVRIAYKKAPPRRQIKDVLCTRFTVNKMPVDDYYGFTLDKDHLYLDGYFNVHHNTGKSLVIADLIKQICCRWPGTSFMMLTHVKELIEQNYAKLVEHWPTAPAGVYSAGVGRKEAHYPIVFGGVQSVVNNVHKFGKVDILLVDECHRISPKANTSYGKIIKFLKKVNPNLIVIGLTATAYRMGNGELIDGELFDHVIVDMTELEVFNWFFEQGYLAYLTPFKGNVEIDLTGVRKQGGEFVQADLQAAADKEWITKQAVAEMAAVAEAEGREHWLIFGSGVDHVEHIVTEIQAQGYTAVAVHSKMPEAQRDKNIELYLKGEVTALVNMGVLTTGFDAPHTDLMGILRATNSASLWVQILGRGTRPVFAPGFDLTTKEGRLAAIAASSKQDCLVLDFAGNGDRLGPINDPVTPKKKKAGGGEAPIRTCDECNFQMHPSIRTCPKCGKYFPPEVKFAGKSGDTELIAKKRKDAEPEVHVFGVTQVSYMRKQGKAGKPNYMEVSYLCGLRRFTQPICLEHEGFAKKKARDWWRAATGVDDGELIPATIGEAMQRQGECKAPKNIRVWVNKKYPQILNVDYIGELDEHAIRDNVDPDCF